MGRGADRRAAKRGRGAVAEWEMVYATRVSSRSVIHLREGGRLRSRPAWMMGDGQPRGLIILYRLSSLSVVKPGFGHSHCQPHECFTALQVRAVMLLRARHA